MKYLLYAAIIVMFSLAFLENRYTPDYQHFDSIIAESERLHDSALIVLEDISHANDSLMEKKWGK